MGNDIFVWIEQFNGQVAASSWESLGLARNLVDVTEPAPTRGGRVCACLFGQGVEGLAQEAIAYGADTVLLADDPTLADVRLEPCAALLARLAHERQPAAILMGATSRGRDLAPAVAVDLETGCVADCTALEIAGGQLTAIRPVYAGKLLAILSVPHKQPAIFTIRARAFPRPPADPARSGEVVRVEAALTEEQIACKVVGFQAAEGSVNLADAAIIVSGGRGMGGPEGFGPLRELAGVLNGALGASRAAVDAGWIPYEYQVGQTGKTVSPDLYIACGISGAIQHQAGMRTSRVIVAINKDADAPIFQLAHYGIVGDVSKIVPALTAALKERLG